MELNDRLVLLAQLLQLRVLLGLRDLRDPLEQQEHKEPQAEYHHLDKIIVLGHHLELMAVWYVQLENIWQVFVLQIQALVVVLFDLQVEQRLNLLGRRQVVDIVVPLNYIRSKRII